MRHICIELTLPPSLLSLHLSISSNTPHYTLSLIKDLEEYSKLCRNCFGIFFEVATKDN